MEKHHHVTKDYLFKFLREGVSFLGHREEVTGLGLAGSDTLLSVSADGALASWNLRNKVRSGCPFNPIIYLCI